MAKLLSVAILSLCLLPSASFALEFKNIRPCYGAPIGATRQDLKLIPGDVIFISYDIEGLTFDPKTGNANFVTTLEMLDSKEKVLFEKKGQPSEAAPQLGGTRMPGDIYFETSRDHAPGKYSLRLTVEDKLAKMSKSFKFDYELLPKGFGLVGMTAPAVGFPGQQYFVQFALVDLTLDKNNMPDVEITMRVLDAGGTKEVTKPVKSVLPKDLPDEIKLDKQNFVPTQFPIYLNRAGTFMIEVNATDKAGKKTIQVKYPLTVIEVPGGK